MPIENLRRFHCPICDYTTYNKATIELIEKTGICPACQNGKSICYSKKLHPKRLPIKYPPNYKCENFMAKSKGEK
jgi:hypothetical protein